jgi:hypothetical protein
MALIDTNGPIVWGEGYSIDPEWRNDGGAFLFIRDENRNIAGIIQMSLTEATALSADLEKVLNVGHSRS